MSQEKHAVVASQKPSIFWIMPFQPRFKEVYDFFKDHLKQYNFINAEDNNNQGAILADIIPAIIKAQFVIADVSGISSDFDGRPLFNANVMFELGIAMSFRRRVVMITDKLVELPFDIKTYKVHEYGNTEYANLKKLFNKISVVLQDATAKYSNPVSDYAPGVELTSPHTANQQSQTLSMSVQESLNPPEDKVDAVVCALEAIAYVTYALEILSVALLEKQTIVFKTSIFGSVEPFIMIGNKEYFRGQSSVLLLSALDELHTHNLIEAIGSPRNRTYKISKFSLQNEKIINAFLQKCFR